MKSVFITKMFIEFFICFIHNQLLSSFQTKIEFIHFDIYELLFHTYLISDFSLIFLFHFFLHRYLFILFHLNFVLYFWLIFILLILHECLFILFILKKKFCITRHFNIELIYIYEWIYFKIIEIVSKFNRILIFIIAIY